jgi:hypothetical protein
LGTLNDDCTHHELTRFDSIALKHPCDVCKLKLLGAANCTSVRSSVLSNLSLNLPSGSARVASGLKPGAHLGQNTGESVCGLRPLRA